MRAAKVQASLRIRAVSPEPSLLAHISSESRGTFRQKARSLAPLNGWACAVEICHDGMLEDTNSLDGDHFVCLVVWRLHKRTRVFSIRKQCCSWWVSVSLISLTCYGFIMNLILITISCLRYIQTAHLWIDTFFYLSFTARRDYIFHSF